MELNPLSRTVLAAALLMLPTVSSHAAVRYTVTDLTPLTAQSAYAHSINDGGQVAGYLSPSQTFLYSNGATQLIDPPGGKAAFAINASGQMAGVSGSRAFSYSNGVTTDLGTLGGSTSSAYGINDSGQVTGEAQIASGHHHAFITVNGVMTDLGFLPDLPGYPGSSQGHAINNQGLVTGVSSTSVGGGGFHAFIASVAGGMQDLQLNGGVFQNSRNSWGWAINDGGQVAGFADTSNNERHAFLTVGGVMTDLGMLGRSSEARGINDAGQVVGFFDSGISNNLGTFRAFATIDGVMTDLNTLIALDSGWTLMQALDVNNSGQIVGWGRTANGQQHAFLLNPVAAVPLPSAFILFASGFLVWTRSSRFRRYA